VAAVSQRSAKVGTQSPSINAVDQLVTLAAGENSIGNIAIIAGSEHFVVIFGHFRPSHGLIRLSSGLQILRKNTDKTGCGRLRILRD
jgi:hypothetical protein